ncbi:hypothetical protein [Vallitalea sp.]|jgi:hypothetical protein|uniref:hypothetical protein n=1 Tax=Vallitalea sp. TaxID=1882829 RepID=UPI0025F6CDBB|nr:hypothetical protein [Vallitalea sp.]MCT4687110.1 hypothetical protein [Vallitalea sp.]
MKEKRTYERKETIIDDKIKALTQDMEVLQSNVDDSEVIAKEFNRYSPFEKLNREMVDGFIDCIEIDHRGRLGIVWNFKDIF